MRISSCPTYSSSELFLQIFPGNSDRNSVMKNILSPAISARHVRIHPVSWTNWISMRIELYGCYRGTVFDCKSNVIKLYIKKFP